MCCLLLLTCDAPQCGMCSGNSCVLFHMHLPTSDYPTMPSCSTLSSSIFAPPPPLTHRELIVKYCFNVSKAFSSTSLKTQLLHSYTKLSQLLEDCPAVR